MLNPFRRTLPEKNDQIDEGYHLLQNLQSSEVSHFDQLRNDYNARLDQIDQKQNELNTQVIASFDQLRNEYNARLDQIDQKQNEYNARLNQVDQKQNELNTQVISHFDQLRNEYNVRLNAIDQRQNELRELMDVRNLHYEMMFWQLYRKPDETTEEAKKRFFMNLPKAEGNLRLLQLGNAFLLEKLVDICKAYNLTIWLAGGTLLGAFRHQGFIPWDDDIDTNMFREDIEKLQKIIRDNPQYKITTVYDYIVKCRQIRFRFRDDRIPCFVDIFYVDYCIDDSVVTWDKQNQIRSELVALMNNENVELKEWKQKKFLTPTNESTRKIESIFDKYQGKMVRAQVVVNKEEAKATIFSIDNLTATFHDSSSLKDMFPLTMLQFEEREYPVPKNYSTYLRKHYGDIYRLPNDMVWHNHVAYKEMDTEDMKNALVQIIKKTER